MNASMPDAFVLLRLRNLPLLLFSLALLSYPVVCVVLPHYMNRHAALMVLLSLFMGWRGLRLLSPELKYLYRGGLIYVGFALLSLINNTNWQFAGWRFEKYYPFLLLPLFAGACARLGRKLLAAILVLGLCACALGAALVSAYQLWHLGVDRVGWGGTLNSNIFGHLAALAAVVLFALGYAGRFRGRALGCTAFAIPAFFAAWASGSRGVMLGVVAAILSVSLGDFLLRNRSRVRLCQGLAALLLLGGLGVGAMSQSVVWKSQWSNMGEELENYRAGDHRYTSVGARMDMYYGAYLIWRQHPLLGTGLGDVRDDIDRLVDRQRLPVLEDSFAILHNVFADAAASTGFLGLCAMILAIFYRPLVYLARQLKRGAEPKTAPYALAGISVVALNLVFGLTNSWLYLRGFLFTLMLSIVLLLLAGGLSSLRAKPEIED